MEIISTEITIIVVLFAKLGKGSPPCSWNQITRLDGNKTICWDCPTCPHGHGLTPQCGSYVSTDVPIKCEKCTNGVSYSDVNDISSCKPCSICGPNEYTLRHCNSTHNAICGQCKPGYYREITFDCWPCTTCCPDFTSDELVQECLNQGLPARQSCRPTFRTDACAKKRTTTTTKATTKTHPIPTTTTPTSAASTMETISATQRTVVNHTVIVVQHHYHSFGSQGFVLAVGLFVLVCCVIGFSVFCFCKLRKKFNYTRTYTSEQGTAMLLNQKGDTV